MYIHLRFCPLAFASSVVMLDVVTVCMLVMGCLVLHLLPQMTLCFKNLEIL